MDKIQLLPDSVANQIAAGEVIQRPASVIKELMENSVDAGATKISVLIINAGRTSMQVVDDGVGMSVTDARLAFERHATSKIRKADDLFTLNTMGFRGEALPSIASVAQVTLKTRTEENPIGTCLHIEGGRFDSQEPVACPKGCNFIVENLFFNVPVRRKFLKSNVTEMNNIVTAFQRIALVYPDIHFTLSHNGQELYNLPATNTHRRIVDIFGKKIDSTLLPLEVETSLGKVYGFIGKPESAHKKNVQQYFFVNGRFMKHAAFHKAVMSAYERLIPQGEQIPYFIYLNVKPEDIDVNIHPTKTEIKFQDESAVWQIISAAAREAVGRFSTIPTIDFDTEDRPDIPAYNDAIAVTPPTIDINPQYNPFAQSESDSRPATSNAQRNQKSGSSIHESALNYDKMKVQHGWEALYDNLNTVHPEKQDTTLFGFNSTDSKEETIDPGQLDSMIAADDIASTRSNEHYQYKGSYIITAIPAGLMVTDQELAHERILFERYMKDMARSTVASQRLLFPDAVQFTVAEMLMLPEILPEMESLGFELTNLGGGNYAINAVPASLGNANAAQTVSNMVSAAVESNTNVRNELYTSLAASMAHNTSIVHGQVLSAEEMENIIASLLACENTRYSPSGKEIYHIIPDSEIRR
ncbi:MAG: DNA mismatch repair endonuclease MutL [Prevotella sp.]|nr:DNA mismatch repair endonuclease MutL [Prevotella sp.]